MADVVVDPYEAPEGSGQWCAKQQYEAAAAIRAAAKLVHATGPKNLRTGDPQLSKVWTTHGVFTEASNSAIDQAAARRNDACEAAAKMCEELALSIGVGMQRYIAADEATAANINRHLVPGDDA